MESIWKPMKTAPKDGTEVLLKIGKKGYAVGSWQDFELQVGWFVGHNWIGEDVFISRPVGWLEIPK